MPGWHEKTLELQKSGKLQVIGLIQEQHPDRCRLFQQWKRMRWPILVDSLNLLGVRAVPYAFLIDEHGVVRKARAKSKDLPAFLDATFDRPKSLPAPRGAPDIEKLQRDADSNGDADSWLALGDAQFLLGDIARLDAAANAYRTAIKQGAGPEAKFRLGVTLRRRYETKVAHSDDFRRAIELWGAALEARPGQYIWRRRIQQYGPRLEKPYAFYDWVPKARADIAARGETPHSLRVEPGGAEFARPLKSFLTDSAKRKEPDRRDALPRDEDRLILAKVAVAPSAVKVGKTARVHVHLDPNADKKAHWNNEAGETVLWLRPPKGVEVDRLWHTAPKAKTPESSERRQLEFEVKIDEVSKADRERGHVAVPCYVTYFVCEGKNGVCFYFRQDLRVEVPIRKK